MPLPFAPSLTLLIPAYNERENLPRVLPEALAFVRTACAACEVLVIDDGSSDGTAEYLRGVDGIRVITHERNGGLTAALRTGFFSARNDFVTWIPADGQIPLTELGKILAAWQGEDLVLSTYRHRPDGAIRLLMSRTVRVLLRAATGLTERLEGPYLFRRALLDELNLVSKTSAGSIGLELAAKVQALHKRIGTTEIECAPRLSGHSKVANLRNITQYLVEIWRIRKAMQQAGLR